MYSLSVPIAGARQQLSVLALAGALALGAAAVTPLVGHAQDGGTIDVGTAQDDLVTYLVGPDGMTLYYFTRDVHAGQSRCAGPCAGFWPPLLVEAGQELAAGEGVTGTLGVVARSDGTSMATYRGRPLYYFANDTAVGDTNGQDVGGIWFVALVDGSAPPNPPAVTLELASSELGEFLTDSEGLTLYYFANDTTPGVSECTGGCLEAWPPLTVQGLNKAAAGDGVTGVVGVMPGNGMVRITYDGRPLYYFAGDAAAGDTNGHGLNDVWYVAAVDGTLPSK